MSLSKHSEPRRSDAPGPGELEPAVFAQRLEENIARVLIGKRKAVHFLVIALLTDGHVLLEDAPGVGKTTLVKALARSLGADFRRIQFTPDVLPSDVTGTSIYDPKKGEFRYHPGPVMSNILLADEINRASPKAQSALLECMEERQITVDGSTHTLPLPFFVLATQNPREFHGTFPLPESQLDRFLFSLHLGYPSVEEELALLERYQFNQPLESLSQVFPIGVLPCLQDKVRQVHVSNSLRLYLVKLAESLRSHPGLRLGISPRATLALFRAGQAAAAIQGRSYVLPDDIKELFLPALRHRVFLTGSGNPEVLLAEVLRSTPPLPRN
ncbi:ATPase, AAA-3 [Acididesulfobacillus acetoxydans]|uniref:ATPase associated with various cellular activities AAA 3 n=1 Tax=Acididesulfobacillus acetoxydans TaxID=1561005 RepID=A0A8S0W2T7_9FIRM|nr:MoxR family ATPase [Acididesulfobacillus acetoxydans]CAA7600988.1 ATPase, AAA-3 [Acididesulfobacillus acetoxydans]CEJ07711.1 ATPase associated with various cellular activities AAA 3 [Acididesulfobacillus acetoxydans]